MQTAECRCPAWTSGRADRAGTVGSSTHCRAATLYGKMTAMPEPERDEPQSSLSKQDYSGYEPPDRPGTVTGAAVIAFILAASQVYGSFSAFAAASALSGRSAHTGVLYALGVTGILVSALLLWGGIAAMRGTS